MNSTTTRSIGGIALFSIFLIILSSNSFAYVHSNWTQNALDSTGNNVTTNVTYIDNLYASKSYLGVNPDYLVNISINTGQINNIQNNSLFLNYTLLTTNGIVLNVYAYYWNGTNLNQICASAPLFIANVPQTFSCNMSNNYNSSGYSTYVVEATALAAFTGDIEYDQVVLNLNSNSIGNSCPIINEPGTYYMTQDLIGATNNPIPLRTNGCVMIYADNVILDGNGFSITNNATDDAVGIGINASNVEVKNLNSVSLYYASLFGFTGNNNTIHNSSFITNQLDMAFYQMNNTAIYNNTIINAVSEGIAIGYSHNLSIYDNYFYNESVGINATSLGNTTNIYNNRFNYTGYAIAIQNAFSNVSYNNIFNSTYGIGVLGDDSLYLKDTVISYNNISTMIQIGIQLSKAQNTTVSFNDVSQSFAGIYSTFDLNGPTLLGNIIHDNGFGTTIDSTNQSSISYEHYFNNTQDLQLSSLSSDLPLLFNATYLIFDSPLGNYQNFTNISINDVLDPHSRYFFNWSAQPATLFTGDISFNNKYINFSSENETKLIDQIIWHWTSAEEAGHISSNLRNKFYNDSWQNLSAIPNTVEHTLTQTNISHSGLYGIVEANISSTVITNCIAITSSNNYTLSANLTGAPIDASQINGGTVACILINASNVNLDCNQNSISNTGIMNSYGIGLSSISNVTLSNCMINGYDSNIYLKSSSNNLIENSTLTNATTYSSVFESSSLNNVVNRCNIDVGQFYINGFSTGNLIQNSNLTRPASNGNPIIQIRLSNNNQIYNNQINSSGTSPNANILMDSSSNVNITFNTIDATSSTFGIYSTNNFFTPSNIYVGNNSITGPQYGIWFYANNGNTAIFNFIDSSVANVYIQLVGSHNISNNYLHGSSYGIQALYSENNYFINNTIRDNQFGISQDMSFIGTSTLGNFIGYNSISNNSVQGVQLLHTINTNLYNNQIFNNTVGEFISGRSINDNVTLSNEHFYGNSQDLNLQTLSANHLIINATNLVFDNPLGNNQNFSNISLNHTLVPIGFSAAYGIKWAAAPAISLPANVTIFNQKFINITATSGNPVINTIQWQWSPSETMGYNETNFTIYDLNTTWIKKGGSLNVGSHTLTLTDLNLGNLVYALVDDETPIPPLTTLVYFVSPTPINNTNITTTPIVIVLNHINGTLSSPCLVQLNGVNQTGTIAGDACSYSFTPTINNTNYTVIGYMNLSGIMVASNETRYFTWFSTVTPPNTEGTYSSGSSLPSKITNNTNTTIITNNTNTTIMNNLLDIPKQYDYNVCVGIGLLSIIIILWIYALRRKK